MVTLTPHGESRFHKNVIAYTLDKFILSQFVKTFHTKMAYITPSGRKLVITTHAFVSLNLDKNNILQLTIIRLDRFRRITTRSLALHTA